MGTQLRVLIIILALITLMGIINMIKKEKLELKYVLLWILGTFCIISMAIFPVTIDYVAYLLNIATPINALFFLGICFILIILFSLTVAQSRNSKKIKNLAQKIALLEYEIKMKRINFNKNKEEE